MKKTMTHARFARAAMLSVLGAGVLVACGGGGGGGGGGQVPPPPPPPVAVKRFVGPTSSQPLALTANDAFLVVANEDNNTVTFFEVAGDANRKLAEVNVEIEPSGVAFMPDGSKAYATNTVSGTVSVIPFNDVTRIAGPPKAPIVVGTEPSSLVLSPNGTRLYVANARSNSVSVIDTATDTVITTINNVGPEPRGLAVTNDGDDVDSDETLYVTQFLSLPAPGRIDGADNAKNGHVVVIATANNAVQQQDVPLFPMDDTGFNSNGDALAKKAPVGDPNDENNLTIATGAYPNQLNSIVLKNGFAYVPNTGASPNGPVRFDTNTQSLLTVIKRTNNIHNDADLTINMHLAVKQQTNPSRLFVTQPWSIGFKTARNEGYVVSAASNHLLKVSVNAATGAPTVEKDPADPGRVMQIPVGKNPRGIVVTSSDTRAYVANFISRDVSVVDLTKAREEVMGTMSSAALPAPGTEADKVHIGKELYNTSIGVFDPAPGSTTPITGRMSRAGWGSCAACHTPRGLSDNVVWIFGSGPKRTISQHTDFDLTQAAPRTHQRALNWSAERDEEEDFELNIRGVSGGQGLIVLADGTTPDPNVVNLRQADPLPQLPSGGRNQLRVRGVPAWDALKAFMQFGIRPPISPVPQNDPDAAAGRAIFAAANCQLCHGGPQWTSSRINFTPAPAASGVDADGQLPDQLRSVGTFNAGFFNEVRANGSDNSLGAAGFVPPSLLSIGAFRGVFLHNGSANTLGEVLNNTAHRTAGIPNAPVDPLDSAADRLKVVKFLESIDAKTPIFP